MAKEGEKSSKEYQEIGNTSMKEGKHFQAVLNYTFAIKTDLRNPELYSNRSLAFLKTGQLYYALEDANQTIKLRPKWAKGHFRKGEVLFAAQQYVNAIEAYQEAHRCQPSDTNLLNLVQQCKVEMAKIKKQDEQLPWIGSALGLVLAVVAIVLEFLLLENKLFPNPFLQAFVIIIASGAGYFVSLQVRKYTQAYRDCMIEKPVDLFQ